MTNSDEFYTLFRQPPIQFNSVYVCGFSSHLLEHTKKHDETRYGIAILIVN